MLNEITIWTADQVEAIAKVHGYPAYEYYLHFVEALSDGYDYPFFEFGPMKDYSVSLQCDGHQEAADRVNKMNRDLIKLLELPDIKEIQNTAKKYLD